METKQTFVRQAGKIVACAGSVKAMSVVAIKK